MSLTALSPPHFTAVGHTPAASDYPYLSIIMHSSRAQVAGTAGVHVRATLSTSRAS